MTNFLVGGGSATSEWAYICNTLNLGGLWVCICIGNGLMSPDFFFESRKSIILCKLMFRRGSPPPQLDDETLAGYSTQVNELDSRDTIAWNIGISLHGS